MQQNDTNPYKCMSWLPDWSEAPEGYKEKERIIRDFRKTEEKKSSNQQKSATGVRY